MKVDVYPYIFIDRRLRNWANRSHTLSITIFFGKSPFLKIPRQDTEFKYPDNYDLWAYQVAFAKAIADRWIDPSWVEAPHRPCPDRKNTRSNLILTFYSNNKVFKDE